MQKDNEQPSSKRSIHAELMKLAAELARGDGIASDCDEDHPTRMTRQHWMTHLERAHEASKDRAVRLRGLIDKLCADEPSAPKAGRSCSLCEGVGMSRVAGVCHHCGGDGIEPEGAAQPPVEIPVTSPGGVHGELVRADETKATQPPCVWRTGCSNPKNCKKLGFCASPTLEERGNDLDR